MRGWRDAQAAGSLSRNGQGLPHREQKVVGVVVGVVVVVGVGDGVRDARVEVVVVVGVVSVGAVRDRLDAIYSSKCFPTSKPPTFRRESSSD